jgi:hypothetical protein
MTDEFWRGADDPVEQAARREAYERLLSAAKRAGMPIERLHEILRRLATNKEETRRFLAEKVYGVPDSLLDDVIRSRMRDDS